MGFISFGGVDQILASTRRALGVCGAIYRAHPVLLLYPVAAVAVTNAVALAAYLGFDAISATTSTGLTVLAPLLPREYLTALAVLLDYVTIILALTLVIKLCHAGLTYNLCEVARGDAPRMARAASAVARRPGRIIANALYTATVGVLFGWAERAYLSIWQRPWGLGAVLYRWILRQESYSAGAIFALQSAMLEDDGGPLAQFRRSAAIVEEHASDDTIYPAFGVMTVAYVASTLTLLAAVLLIAAAHHTTAFDVVAFTRAPLGSLALAVVLWIGPAIYVVGLNVACVVATLVYVDAVEGERITWIDQGIYEGWTGSRFEEA